MKILVADDDNLMLLAISKKLKLKGYSDVISVNNGMSALNFIQENKTDLLICDVMMPGLSGLALLSVLKEFHFHRIPVILISSLDHNTLISKSIGIGAFDFIVKPIDFKQLFLKIETLHTATVITEKKLPSKLGDTFQKST